jgi:hypothetical protein
MLAWIFRPESNFQCAVSTNNVFFFLIVSMGWSDHAFSCVHDFFAVFGLVGKKNFDQASFCRSRQDQSLWLTIQAQVEAPSCAALGSLLPLDKVD